MNLGPRAAFRHAGRLSSTSSVTIDVESLHGILSSDTQVVQEQPACEKAIKTKQSVPVPPGTPRTPQPRARSRVTVRVTDARAERGVEPRDEAEELPSRVRMKLLLARRVAAHFEGFNPF